MVRTWDIWQAGIQRDGVSGTDSEHLWSYTVDIDAKVWIIFHLFELISTQVDKKAGLEHGEVSLDQKQWNLRNLSGGIPRPKRERRRRTISRRLDTWVGIRQDPIRLRSEHISTSSWTNKGMVPGPERRETLGKTDIQFETSNSVEKTARHAWFYAFWFSF